MRLLAPCNTKGRLLVKIQQTQQMCVIIFLDLLNTTYLILNIIFGKFQQTKLKKNTSSRANLKYPIYPCKQEVTTSKFENVNGSGIDRSS